MKPKLDKVLKEINLLLLEYKSTDDDSRIVNVLEAVAKEKQLSKQEGIEEARKNRNAEPAWATEMENRRLKANPPCWNKNY